MGANLRVTSEEQFLLLRHVVIQLDKVSVELTEVSVLVVLTTKGHEGSPVISIDSDGLNGLWEGLLPAWNAVGLLVGFDSEGGELVAPDDLVLDVHDVLVICEHVGDPSLSSIVDGPLIDLVDLLEAHVLVVRLEAPEVQERHSVVDGHSVDLGEVVLSKALTDPVDVVEWLVSGPNDIGPGVICHEHLVVPADSILDGVVVGGDKRDLLGLLGRFEEVNVHSDLFWCNLLQLLLGHCIFKILYSLLGEFLLRERLWGEWLLGGCILCILLLDRLVLDLLLLGYFNLLLLGQVHWSDDLLLWKLDRLLPLRGPSVFIALVLATTMLLLGLLIFLPGSVGLFIILEVLKEVLHGAVVVLLVLVIEVEVIVLHGVEELTVFNIIARIILDIVLVDNSADILVDDSDWSPLGQASHIQNNNEAQNEHQKSQEKPKELLHIALLLAVLIDVLSGDAVLLGDDAAAVNVLRWADAAD